PKVLISAVYGRRVPRSKCQALIQLLSGEIKEGGGEKGEHEYAEEVAYRQGAEEFGPEGKKIGAPREAEDGRQPGRHARGDFGILQQVDDDTEQAEDAAGGDETAGIESAGAGFAFVLLLGGGVNEHADQATGEHGGGGG